MKMWHVPARRIAAAGARVAVEQIAGFVRDNNLADAGEVEIRREAAARAHDQELADGLGVSNPVTTGSLPPST